MARELKEDLSIQKINAYGRHIVMAIIFLCGTFLKFMGIDGIVGTIMMGVTGFYVGWELLRKPGDQQIIEKLNNIKK